MTLVLIALAVTLTWGLCTAVWERRSQRLLAEHDAELDNALDERDLEWVRIVARRDVAILAAVERWPDITQAAESFNDPAQVAEYWAETWRLKGEAS